MAIATQGTAGNYLQRAPSPSGLADVIDTILDKGLVIDAYIRVSLVGIEVVTIDARIVIASVDTYLRFAEAVNRLDISQDKAGITDLAGGGQQGGAAAMATLEAVAGELLAVHHERFAAALAELEGRAEYVVKGRYVEAAVLAEVLSENKQAARLRDRIGGKDPDATRPERIQLGEIINN